VRLAPEIIARKSQCFSSSWWPVERHPDFVTDDEEQTLIERGHPIRYLLLSRGEMVALANFGLVQLREQGNLVVSLP
jgi:hypothetical protein